MDKSHQWKEDTESNLIELDLEQQKFKESSRNYFVVIHDPKTGKV